MKKTMLLIAAIGILFTSCSKDENAPANEKFIGTYVGTITTTVTNFSVGSTNENSKTVSLKITKGSSDNQIILDEGTDGEVKATITGNTFQINDNQNVYINIADSYEQFAYTGGGQINDNDNLVINFSLASTTVSAQTSGILSKFSE